MHFGDKKAPFGILGEAGHTEVEPAFRIDPVIGESAVLDTSKPVLKFRDLLHKLNVPRIEIAVDQDESLPGA